jgi:hypothetical protein
MFPIIALRQPAGPGTRREMLTAAIAPGTAQRTGRRIDGELPTPQNTPFSRGVLGAKDGIAGTAFSIVS